MQLSVRTTVFLIFRLAAVCFLVRSMLFGVDVLVFLTGSLRFRDTRIMGEYQIIACAAYFLVAGFLWRFANRDYVGRTGSPLNGGSSLKLVAALGCCFVVPMTILGGASRFNPYLSGASARLNFANLVLFGYSLTPGQIAALVIAVIALPLLLQWPLANETGQV